MDEHPIAVHLAEDSQTAVGLAVDMEIVAVLAVELAEVSPTAVALQIEGAVVEDFRTAALRVALLAPIVVQPAEDAVEILAVRTHFRIAAHFAVAAGHAVVCRVDSRSQAMAGRNFKLAVVELAVELAVVGTLPKVVMNIRATKVRTNMAKVVNMEDMRHSTNRTKRGRTKIIKLKLKWTRLMPIKWTNHMDRTNRMVNMGKLAIGTQANKITLNSATGMIIRNMVKGTFETSTL